MNRQTLARVLSEVFAPWVANVAFFAVLGVVTGAWASALIAGLGTGVLPMAAIVMLMRQGKVGDHHVTRRDQRALVFAILAVIVAVVAVGLTVWSESSRIVAGIWSALLFLAVFSVVTVGLKIKASIHVGLWVCLSTFLVLAVSPWWLLAYLATPAIAWARYIIKHHTPVELVAGVATGFVVVLGSYFLFLG